MPRRKKPALREMPSTTRRSEAEASLALNYDDIHNVTIDYRVVCQLKIFGLRSSLEVANWRLHSAYSLAASFG